MSAFNLQSKGVFGRYCKIEMYRYGAPNDFFIHKCIGQYRSMTYCDVPLKGGGFSHKPTKHPISSDEPFPDYLEEVILVVECGLDETHVFPVALKDVELLGEDFNTDCEFHIDGSNGYPFCASATEIMRLRDENAKLREELEYATRQVKMLMHNASIGDERSQNDAVDAITQLKAENAKLRALLIDAYVEFVSMYGNADDVLEYANRMRELGIEVSE